MSKNEFAQANTIAATGESGINQIFIVLQSLCNIAAVMWGSSSCPSNREGLRDSLGGSGLSFLI
jgi:hypothetical protein